LFQKPQKKTLKKKHQIFKKHKIFILKIIQETQKKTFKKIFKMFDFIKKHKKVMCFSKKHKIFIKKHVFVFPHLPGEGC